MLIWLLTGLGAAALFAVLVIRNAELHDKKRKEMKRPVTPNNWE
jgi:hypothetical protein